MLGKGRDKKVLKNKTKEGKEEKEANKEGKESKDLKDKKIERQKLDIPKFAVITPEFSSKKALCSFCGRESIASSGTWICEHCECVNEPSTAVFGSNPSLKEIQSKLDTYKLDEFSQALASYEAFAKSAQDNRFAYVVGFLYMRLSDFYLSNLDYNRKDFMYENTLLRRNAAKAESKAKLFLFKASKPGTTPESIFTSFMALLKLGRLRDASSMLAELNALNNKESMPLADYASMLFSIENGAYADAMQSINKLIKENLFIENVAYYQAFILYKVKRYRESMSILEKLLKVGFSNKNLSDLILLISKK